MAYETIIVEISNHICLIRLDRPTEMNALNAQMVTELSDAVQQADSDHKVRCMIITGTEKAFAGGADISEMAGKSFADMEKQDIMNLKLAHIGQARKPIIAAVAGYALGGGLELAMLCDFIVCADTAKFGQPEVNLGIIAGIGGTQRLTKLIGKSKAMEMHLTGRFMSAEEAERAGLVSRVFPADTLIENALKIANKIAEKSQPSIRAAKAAVNTALETPLSEGLKYERALFHALFATEDQKEGMAAFLEKRAPHFRDK